MVAKEPSAGWSSEVSRVGAIDPDDAVVSSPRYAVDDADLAVEGEPEHWILCGLASSGDFLEAREFFAFALQQ